MFIKDGIAYAGDASPALKICGVRPLADWKLWVRFNTGEAKIYDFKPILNYPAFKPLLDEELHSPIITSFNYPAEGNFSFKSFYDFMKKEGYVLYPGKISQADTFRIGNIGDVEVSDIEKMLLSVKKYLNAM